MVPARGGLGHRLEANGLEVARDIVFEPPRRPGVVFENLQQQQPLVPLERPFAGEHLVKDHAQAVDVAAGVDVVRLARAPVRATCTRACPSPGRPTSSSHPPASRLARPKSVTCGRPSLSMRMFDGLTSRWITPWSWAYCKASAISATRCAARRGSAGPCTHAPPGCRPR